jgi:excisionase family DNA binding protein
MNSAANSLPADLSSEQLLELYLRLPPKERAARFADTAHCAEIVGVSQRTILIWIDSGMIRATSVGMKYQVCSVSLTKHLKSRAAGLQ